MKSDNLHVAQTWTPKSTDLTLRDMDNARPGNAAPDQTEVLEHGWTEGPRAE